LPINKDMPTTNISNVNNLTKTKIIENNNKFHNKSIIFILLNLIKKY